MTPELSIIIVNWNGGEVLQRCIESVTRHPPSLSWEIILVDNASTDDSLEWVRQRNLSDLKLVENNENVGFGKANNIAFNLSSAPLLFLLNPDTEVQAHAIDRLVATVRSGPNVGMVGPRIINPDGSLQVSVWRNPLTPWEMIVNAFRLYRFLPRGLRGDLLLGRHWDHSRKRKVNLLWGAAMLLKREVITEVGGFDERFFMYGEDVEWCLRIVRGGWTIIFEPAAEVMHVGGHASAQRWNERERTIAKYQSTALFYRLSLSWWHNIANLAVPCVLAISQMAWSGLRGKSNEEAKLYFDLQFGELKNVLGGARRREHGESPLRQNRLEQ